jgi:hypothetical protein
MTLNQQLQKLLTPQIDVLQHLTIKTLRLERESQRLAPLMALSALSEAVEKRLRAERRKVRSSQ